MKFPRLESSLYMPLYLYIFRGYTIMLSDGKLACWVCFSYNKEASVSSIYFEA